MKKSNILAVIILILSIVAAVGSQTFLGACVHDDGSVGACHWACRAMLGEGALLAALALLALAMKRERTGLYLAMVPVSLLGLVTPGALIAICKMPTMRCRMVSRPAMMILFGAMLIAALGGWLLARREEK